MNFFNCDDNWSSIENLNIIFLFSEKMNMIDNILNFLTSLIGGSLLILIAIVSIFSSIAALLSVSEENRIIFYRFKRFYGVIILLFGSMLYFRGISFFATLLSFSWTLIFFEILPKFLLIQIILTTIGSLIIWIYYFCFSDIIFLQIVGDILLFILVPFVISIVDISRGSELLSRKEKSDCQRPTINLRSFLSKCYSYVEKVFPSD